MFGCGRENRCYIDLIGKDWQIRDFSKHDLNGKWAVEDLI